MCWGLAACVFVTPQVDRTAQSGQTQPSRLTPPQFPNSCDGAIAEEIYLVWALGILCAPERWAWSANAEVHASPAPDCLHPWHRSICFCSGHHRKLRIHCNATTSCQEACCTSEQSSVSSHGAGLRQGFPRSIKQALRRQTLGSIKRMYSCKHMFLQLAEDLSH